ncbi:A disintegrin and metalloproteinase with thrombospondin motifs adt-1-like isoform X2 [Periplaneta americana]|uniref:A disintegrin and metalloproteinase with thrombospondin motifs adt-1-like isoform X2 n=1 Tax=Periplaneta americana TaxID=6978 RepID=UPI0037E774E5
MCVLGRTRNCVPVTETNLRDLLTTAEWTSLLGASSDAPEFAVVLPVRRRRRRRWLLPDETGAIPVSLDARQLGRRFDLRLVPSPALLDPSFVLLSRWRNRTDMLSPRLAEPHCFYRGDDGPHRAAVALCGGDMRGIIASPDDEYYVINPLPRRFRRRSADVPHVLVRWTPPAQRLDQALRPRAAKNPAARRRRSPALPPGAPVHVETAVFIDEDLFQHMALNFPQDTERELVRVVLAMINAVQLLYHDPSLGRQVNFVLKRLEILHVDPTSLQRPHDIDRFLSSFCTWQRSENPPRDSDPLHWDHALILTGLDLYVVNKNGKVSSQVVGLAPVAGMCTATSSCTVNEGRHFESVYVVAHELGHNLGMRHDGPTAGNECDSSSYIMSPTLGSGKITWSSCSRRYLQLFLETPQSQCLLDHSISGGQLDHNAEGTLPGERFNADQQCMLKYGRGSIHATQQPLDDVCRDLHCQRDRYTWTSHPALEGTSCGNTKWCRSGRCVARGLSALEAGYSPNQRVDGGWSEWTSFSDCASGCLYSEEGRLHAGSTGIMVSTRRCNNPRPENEGLPCRGSDRRFRTCFAEQCGNVQRTTIRDFADQICLRAREVDTELLGTGLQRISSDAEEACTVWCYKRNGGSKSRGWNFPDGTACQSHRSRYGKSMYCIAGRCEEFVCDNYDMAPFSTLPEMCPVSSRLQVSRNKGRRREVPELRRLWSPASGCHFNCLAPGRGLRLVVAKDIKCRLEDNCEGGRVTSIQLCEPDKLGCGRLKTPFEHATTVCSKYRERVRRLSGFGMQISPVAQDPDRPCRVACQDDEVNHRFYLVNGEDGWFPFGTDCSRGVPEKKSYCVSGKCLEFGSDDTPVHESEYTLPLIGRLKRSLVYNSTTMVRTTLDQTTLDHIISKLNSTDNCNHQYGSYGNQFSIDLNNPVHVEVKTGTGQFNNEARGYEDIWRSPG